MVIYLCPVLSAGSVTVRLLRALFDHRLSGRHRYMSAVPVHLCTALSSRLSSQQSISISPSLSTCLPLFSCLSGCNSCRRRRFPTVFPAVSVRFILMFPTALRRHSDRLSSLALTVFSALLPFVSVSLRLVWPVPSDRLSFRTCSSDHLYSALVAVRWRPVLSDHFGHFCVFRPLSGCLPVVFC